MVKWGGPISSDPQPSRTKQENKQAKQKIETKTPGRLRVRWGGPSGLTSPKTLQKKKPKQKETKTTKAKRKPKKERTPPHPKSSKPKQKNTTNPIGQTIVGKQACLEHLQLYQTHRETQNHQNYKTTQQHTNTTQPTIQNKACNTAANQKLLAQLEQQSTILGEFSVLCNLHPFFCNCCVLLTTL